MSPCKGCNLKRSFHASEVLAIVHNIPDFRGAPRQRVPECETKSIPDFREILMTNGFRKCETKEYPGFVGKPHDSWIPGIVKTKEYPGFVGKPHDQRVPEMETMEHADLSAIPHDHRITEC